MSAPQIELTPAALARRDMRGTVRVLGGAGTGKSTLLVDTAVAHMAAGCDPESVLLLTGSARLGAQAKAAITATLLSSGERTVVRQPLVRTVHSYAFAVLRLAAQRNGSPPPRLITSAEQDGIIRELLAGDVEDGDASPVRWPARLRPALPTVGFATELRDLLSRCSERGVDPVALQRLGRLSGREEWQAAGRFAQVYEQVMLLRSAVGMAAPSATVPALGAAELVGAALEAFATDAELLAADPTAGTAAMRVLTGPRWRFGARDIAALWRRARRLDDVGPVPPERVTEQIVAQVAPDADTACLADAICDPGPADAYSPEGYTRIVALARELTALRCHLDIPLPDLVAEVRRLLGVDTEVRAAQPVSAGWSGTEHLDAFGDVVADFATRPGATVSALLAFLDAAEQVENGLAPAEITVSQDRVQILTVHAAKGLEWQIVAVPHLSARVFPSTASPRTWLTDAADLPPLLRGDCAVVSEHGVPVLDTSSVNDRKALSDTISEHKRSLDQRRTDEERRLLYVAVTRAERALLVSGHHWGATESKPRGPSTFLEELRDVIEEADAAGRPCGVVDVWAQAPADGETNPLKDEVVEALWPVDPVGDRRVDTDRGADLVAQAMTAELPAPEDVHGWGADVDALLAERERAAHRPSPPLPTQISVSTMVELGRDPVAVAQRLQRRLPRRPDPEALLGTAFHDWVQRYFQAEKLFDLDDLPGAVDADRHVGQLEELQEAFAVSRWAARTPLEVEVPFDMVIAGRVVRGRIDAVFADDDGGTTVVDWKTGEPPKTPEELQRNAVQLAVYRIAWARLHGCPESSVRAVFHYVRSGRTVAPDSLPGADELAELFTAA